MYSNTDFSLVLRNSRNFGRLGVGWPVPGHNVDLNFQVTSKPSHGVSFAVSNLCFVVFLCVCVCVCVFFGKSVLNFYQNLIDPIPDNPTLPQLSPFAGSPGLLGAAAVAAAAGTGSPMPGQSKHLPLRTRQPVLEKYDM